MPRQKTCECSATWRWRSTREVGPGFCPRTGRASLQTWQRTSAESSLLTSHGPPASVCTAGHELVERHRRECLDVLCALTIQRGVASHTERVADGREGPNAADHIFRQRVRLETLLARSAFFEVAGRAEAARRAATKDPWEWGPSVPLSVQHVLSCLVWLLQLLENESYLTSFVSP